MFIRVSVGSARSWPTRPARVERRPAGQLGAVDQHDVGLAQLGQVIGDAGATDTAADDDDRGRGRQSPAGRGSGHGWTLLAFGLDRCERRAR